MSTKIGIIAEGPIDHALLPALLSRLAVEVGVTWPVRGEDMAAIFQIRKRGHGGVLETVRKLVEVLDTQFFDHHCFIVALDRRTLHVQEEVRKLIAGRDRFVLAVPVEEIEAWWLGDRTNTLAWTGLATKLTADCRYAAIRYKSEKDDAPKKTLDELTRISAKFDRCYGEGNVDLALDFAEDYWQHYARLDEIKAQCPKSYRPFHREVVNRLRPLLKRQSRG